MIVLRVFFIRYYTYSSLLRSRFLSTFNSFPHDSVRFFSFITSHLLLPLIYLHLLPTFLCLHFLIFNPILCYMFSSIVTSRIILSLVHAFPSHLALPPRFCHLFSSFVTTNLLLPPRLYSLSFNSSSTTCVHLHAFGVISASSFFRTLLLLHRFFSHRFCTVFFHRSGTSNASLTPTIIDFKLGDRVIIKSSQGSKVGIVRYVGTTDFAPGEWCGVELDGPRGKNDGSVDGRRLISIIIFRVLFDLLWWFRG